MPLAAAALQPLAAAQSCSHPGIPSAASVMLRSACWPSRLVAAAPRPHAVSAHAWPQPLFAPCSSRAYGSAATTAWRMWRATAELHAGAHACGSTASSTRSCRSLRFGSATTHGRSRIHRVLACTAAAVAEDTAPGGSLGKGADDATSDFDEPPVGGTTVDGVPETQKYILADEWGYTQVGSDLPSGTSSFHFSNIIPDRFFDEAPRRIVAAFTVPLALMAAGYGWLGYMHAICPLWQQALCALVIGTGYAGLFKLAHEAARFSLMPNNLVLQDLLGSLIMAPGLYSFQAWRLGLLHHWAHVNMLWDDTFAWHPLTKEDVLDAVAGASIGTSVGGSAQPAAAGEPSGSAGDVSGPDAGEAAAAGAGGDASQPGPARTGAIAAAGGAAARVLGAFANAFRGLELFGLWLSVATPLKLLGSIGHWARSFESFDLRKFTPDSHAAILASWALPLLFMGFAFPAIFSTGGVAGFLSWWLAPWLVFHGWLSLLTMPLHTGPHIPFKADGAGYDHGQAVVCGTVTVRMPRWLEFVLNDANYVLPQYLAPGLPFYHAREAYDAVKRRLGPYLTEANLNLKLLMNQIMCWQVYDTERARYITFDQAVSESKEDLVDMREALLELVAAQRLQEEQQSQQEQQQQPEGGAPQAA